MSKSKKKKKVVVTTQKSDVKPTVSKRKVMGAATAKTTHQPKEMMFSRENYLWMIGGAALMILGLILMSGGKMPDPNTWDESIIYSARRMVLAPIVMLGGLGVTAYAIFK